MGKYTPFIYLGVFAIIVWIVYQLMKRIGLIKETHEIQKDKEVNESVKEITSSDLFNPLAYKEGDVYNTSLASNATVKKWAERIDEAIGWFWDDEVAIYGVFREMHNKLNVSQLSDAYLQLYNADLLGDLQSNLNDEELAKIWTIIKKLP